jgi:N-acetylneuraminic acid mutarotase
MSHNGKTALLGLCIVLAACDNTSTRNPTGPGLSEAEGTELQGLSDRWSAKHSLSPNRNDMVAGAINGIIYVVGGVHTDWVTAPFRSYQLSRVDAYNTATNAWSRVASLPGPRFQANGASVINGRLYVTGGNRFGPTASYIPTKTLFVYDPGTNSWGRKADMPQPGCNGVQGVIAGKLYVYMPSIQACDGFSSSTVVRFYRYNPATDTWVSRALPPAHLSFPAGGVIDGKFYIVASTSSSLRPSPLYVYEPVSNTWQEKASMSQSRASMVGAVLNGRLYMVGGNDVGSEQPQPRLEVYNPMTNSWAIKTALRFGTTDGAAVGAAGKVYYITGRIFPTEGGWELLPEVSEVYAYTP